MKGTVLKLLTIGAVMFALVGFETTACWGWSLWNPFASQNSKNKKNTSKMSHKQPSTWEKIVAAPGNFFNQIGETLGLKKPPKKAKPTYAYPVSPLAKVQKKESSKSWFGSWFQPSEPKKPRTVSEWMDENKRLDP